MPAVLLAAAFALAACDRAPPRAPADATTGAEEAAVAAAVVRFAAGTPARGDALPDDIVRGLSTDARVLDCADGVSDGRSAFQAGWVAVHRADLDADGRDDWLVEGRHHCLAGADGADWWLYAEGEEGRRLLFAAGRGRALELLPSRSHGFSDLRLLRDASDMQARYDGMAYRPSATSRD